MINKSKKTCPECLCLIGEKARAKIIRLLKEKSLNVSRITAYFCLTQPTITHHLKTLEGAGILYSEKVGREKFYSLNQKYPCKKCGIFDLPLKP